MVVGVVGVPLGRAIAGTYYVIRDQVVGRRTSFSQTEALDQDQDASCQGLLPRS